MGRKDHSRAKCTTLCGSCNSLDQTPEHDRESIFRPSDRGPVIDRPDGRSTPRSARRHTEPSRISRFNPEIPHASEHKVVNTLLMETMTITVQTATVVRGRIYARVVARSNSAHICLDIDTTADPASPPEETAYDVALAHLDPA